MKGNFENIKTPVFVELEERQYFAANTLSEVNNYWNFSVDSCKHIMSGSSYYMIPFISLHLSI